MSVSRGPAEEDLDPPPLGARMRWMPSYEGGDRTPDVPTRLWWRWLSWKAGRDGVHPCAARMAKHLTFFADERTGRITAFAAAIEVYAAHHLVSTRTAWTDRKRLMALGVLREEVAPTYGRSAVYRVCVPPQALAELAEMPVGLAHEFARHFGLPIGEAPVEEDQEQETGGSAAAGIRRTAEQLQQRDETPGGSVVDTAAAAAATKPGADVDGPHSAQDEPRPAGRDEDLEIDLGPVPRSLAWLHQYLSGCEVVRLGSATGPRRASAVSCGRLHTTPLSREAFSPSLRPQPSEGRKRRSQGIRIKITPQERATAEELMHRCWRAWIAQRGPAPLTPAEWAALVPVVAHAIRAADNLADVREELSHAIGTARHLPTLLAYRARRIIHRGHRHHADPTLRPEVRAARQRAAEAAQAGRQATDRAAATLTALRADLADKRVRTMTAVPSPITQWATEPEQPTTPPPADPEETEARRRRALALARARRGKIIDRGGAVAR